MPIKYFETEEQYDKITKSKGLVIVSFAATWCPPCRAVGPYYEQYSEEYENAHFFKIQLGDEEEPEKDKVFRKAVVTTIPSFVFYENGHFLKKLVSSNPGLLKHTIEEYYR